MDEDFDAQDFSRQLNAGSPDSQFREVLKNLTLEQLDQVTELTSQLTERNASGSQQSSEMRTD